MKQTGALLTIAVLALGLGRGWEHLFFDPPYREVLWDESLMKPIVRVLFGISWQEYVTQPYYDLVMQRSIRVGGLVWIGLSLCMAITGFWQPIRRQRIRRIMAVSTGILTAGMLILSLFLFKKQFYHVGQLFENALQVATPVVWFAFMYHGWSHKLEIGIRLAIALTFGCHGLYAVGYYPVPREFVEMTLNILTCDQTTAIRFLKIVGMIDFLVSLLLLIPGKWNQWVLIYISGWGLITAFARLWGHWHTGYEAEAIWQYTHQVLYRLPHGLIPIALLLNASVFHRNGTPGYR